MTDRKHFVCPDCLIKAKKLSNRERECLNPDCNRGVFLSKHALRMTTVQLEKAVALALEVVESVVDEVVEETVDILPDPFDDLLIEVYDEIKEEIKEETETWYNKLEPKYRLGVIILTLITLLTFIAFWSTS